MKNLRKNIINRKIRLIKQLTPMIKFSMTRPNWTNRNPRYQMCLKRNLKFSIYQRTCTTKELCLARHALSKILKVLFMGLLLLDFGYIANT